MNVLAQIIVMAFLVEAIWETLKMTWEEGKFSKDKMGALIVGLIIALTMNIDLFISVGLEPIFKYTGVIATGILISRGGNYIHDLIKKLNQEM